MKRSKSVELFLALGLSATLFACDGGTPGEGGEQEGPNSAPTSSVEDDGGEGGEDGAEAGEEEAADEGGEGCEG